MAKLAVTIGDISGIGTEIVCKALIGNSLTTKHTFIIFGDQYLLQREAEKYGFTQEIKTDDTGEYKEVGLYCFHCPLGERYVHYGKAIAEYAHFSLILIEKAVQEISQGRIDALCTAPINKQALQLAGIKQQGHTEILASLTHRTKYAMMFVSDNLCVVLVTIHVGLKQALCSLSSSDILEKIRLCNNFLLSYSISKKIAVCGINPHAGENGLFGEKEEEMIILPAIIHAQKEGIDVEGPFAADTIFHRAINGEFQAVIAHYHDQGLIPIKTSSSLHAINITLGLPFLRTSVCHGTAYDIAGKNKADATPMKYALAKNTTAITTKNINVILCASNFTCFLYCSNSYFFFFTSCTKITN